MALEENTNRVLGLMGADYVRRVRKALATVRTVKSKTTGKTYRKKVDNTGSLSSSYKYSVEGKPLELIITANSYADDVNEGTPRNAGWAMLINWIRNKPYKFNGFNEPKKVDNMAQFLSQKIRRIGSDRTGFLDGVSEAMLSKYTIPLEEAIAEDIADSIAAQADKLPNIKAKNI